MRAQLAVHDHCHRRRLECMGANRGAGFGVHEQQGHHGPRRKGQSRPQGRCANTAEPILLLAPYKAQLEYRPATAPAALHEKDAELMVVLQGTGNIVTGGKLVNEKRNNTNNLSGTRSRAAFAGRRQRRHDHRAGEHAAPGHPDRRRADRADDHARAVSAGRLAAGELEHDPENARPRT